MKYIPRIKLLENNNEGKTVVCIRFQRDNLVSDKEPLVEKEFSKVERYRLRIDEAEGFSGVWEIVKDTVKVSLGKHKVGYVAFLG